MTRRLPLLAACVMAAVALLPASADAQHHHGGGGHVAIGATVVVGGGGYYGYPYAYGGWYPYSYGYWYPSPYYGGYYGGPAPYYYDNSSSLRIEVTPRQTEVFVDGYYAGIVDNFDGTFQRLNLQPGEHELQLFLPGHRPVTQHVYLQPRQTFRVRYTMQPLAPGEQEPLRPAGASQGPDPRTQGPGPRTQGPVTAPPRGRAPADAGPVDRIEASPRSDYGTVAIRVQPGDALVLIDGERWEGGSGDERLIVQLAPGSHRIEARKAGYRGYMTEVVVRAGETAPLNVALAREP